MLEVADALTTVLKYAKPLKTEAIYRRYAIVDGPMLKDAAVKLDQLHQADNETETRKVIPLEK